MESLDLSESRIFVLEQARRNIAEVTRDKSYVDQAKQVNSSLASIVACDRNAVMLEAIRRSKTNELR